MGSFDSGWGVRAACAAVLLLPLAAGGCSSGTSGLTTGSLLPGAAKPKPADPPLDRALSAAATSARAARCGYNFDAVKLRASYIAYETQTSGPEQGARVEKAYDSARASIAAKISGESDYCSEAQTDKIKAALTRNLAGDFTVVAAAAPAGEPGLFGFGNGKSTEEFDKNKAFCPTKFCP